jgi:hypothetical protein
MAKKKKYNFERGDYILDSYIIYLKEGGYRNHNKHRYIIGRCSLCDTIRAFALEPITSGKMVSCGCYHKQMIEQGVLTEYSTKSRKKKPYLQRGGYNWKKGIVVHIPDHIAEMYSDVTLGDLIKTLEGEKNE